MILFYDTETTGLPLWRKPSEHPDQPHICQLAALLTDDEGNGYGSMDMLIRPDGWTIPDEATEIHGISTEKATQGGVPANIAIGAFLGMWRKSDIRVAHNESFDARLVRIQLKRGDGPDCVDEWKAGKAFCTLKAATGIVNLPPTEKMLASGFNKPKPPKLGECIKHFFGEELEGAHDALVDVRACARVYFHLRKLGAAP